ncbi:hypothetical protein B0H19DRAFT_1068866 [Mycena capillaripes]|nr:hypothetical protein B0H19DRAFT_1068866 [Mycena capillaripes]
MSSRKDHVCIVGNFKLAASFTKEEVEHKIETLVDNALALPTTKHKLLRYEIVDASVELLTPEQMAAILEDEETRKLIASAMAELQLQANGCVFAADAMTMIDKPSKVISTPNKQNRFRGVSIYNFPVNFNKEEFEAK